MKDLFFKEQLGFTLEVVNIHCGKEEQGALWWTIYKVSEPYNIYIKLSSYYDSLTDDIVCTTWDDCLIEVDLLSVT